MNKLTKMILLVAKITRKLKKHKQLTTAERAMLIYFGELNRDKKIKLLR